MNRIIAASKKKMIIDALSDTFRIDTHNPGVMVSIGHDHFPALKNPFIRYDVDTGYNCELLEIMRFFRVPCIEK